MHNCNNLAWLWLWIKHLICAIAAFLLLSAVTSSAEVHTSHTAVIVHVAWHHYGTTASHTPHAVCSLIRSKVDYGAIIYGSARKSYLRMLDPIQNQALRLCLGAFRTSPATSLHVEANEMPMELRRRRLASQYSLKICSNLSNPARNCAFDERFTKLFDKRPNQIRPLGLRVKTDLSALLVSNRKTFSPHLSLLFRHGCLNHHPLI